MSRLPPAPRACLTHSAVTVTIALGLASTLVACKSGGRSDFDACVASADCGGREACFRLESGAGICLTVCDEGQALCDEGEACVPPSLGGVEWACLPGGDVGVDAVCTRSLDCELGAICVTEGASSVCRAACDPTAPSCAGGSACVADSATRGHCGLASGDLGVPSGDQGVDGGAPDGGAADGG